MADQQLSIQVLLSAMDRITKPFKNIEAQNKKLLQGLKGTRDELKQLETTQKQVGRFKELSQGLKDTQARMGEAQQRAKALAQQISATDKPTRALTRSFNAAVREAGQLKSKHQAQAQQLQQLRTRLNEAGVSTRNLGAGERDLRAKIASTTQEMRKQEGALGRLRDKEKQLFEARKRMQGMHSAGMKVAGHGAVMAYAGQRGLRGMAGSLAPGIEFDASMSRVQALARLDKNSPQMQALRQQARDLGAATMFSATEAAQGQAFLAMAGFGPDAIRAAMPGMLDLAKAGGAELAEAADIASNILTGFKLPAAQMSRVGDALVGTFTRSNVDLQMLGDTMKYVAPVAAGLGVDLETAAAMAGKLGDAGIQGSMAGTSLRAILSRLAAPPRMAADALSELNIQTKDAKGNLRALPEILKELADKTRNMGNAQRSGFLKRIAGEEAFSSLSVLVGQADSGGLDTLINSLKTSAGEAARNAKTMGDNTMGSLDELSSTWDDVRITLNDAVTPAVRELTGSITDMLRGLGEWMKANPGLTKGIALTLGGLLALITVLGALTFALGTVLMPFALLRFATTVLGLKGVTVFGLLKTAVLGLGSALMKVGAFLLANPLFLAIALLATAALLIYRNWEPIKAFFINLWDGITARTAAFWQWLKDSFINAALAIAGLKDRFLAIGGQIIEGLWTGLTSRFEAIKQWFLSLGDKIPQWLRDKLGIRSPSRIFAEIGGHSMQGLADGLQGNQETPLSTLSSMGKRMTAAGAGLMMGLTGGAAAAGQGAAVKAPTSPAAGNHYEIHIHAAPGMDAQAIALEVRRQLDARDREQAAKKRSALYDPE